jgi:hypothetical protein
LVHNYRRTTEKLNVNPCNLINGMSRLLHVDKGSAFDGMCAHVYINTALTSIISQLWHSMLAIMPDSTQMTVDQLVCWTETSRRSRKLACRLSSQYPA